MANYYVNTNAQSNGDHEVHTSICSRLPEAHHRKYLGEFSTCSAAVTEAKKTYVKSNGCFYCANACHSS